MAKSVDVSSYQQNRDRAHVISLWQAVFPDDPPWNEPAALIDTKLTVLPELFLVARQADRLVGTVVGGFDGFRGWMYHVATEANFRRKGVATALVGELETRLRALGCKKLNLQVRTGNDAVTSFYEGLGYSAEPRVSLGKRL